MRGRFSKLREFVIALDIGATSAKVVVFELNGKLVAEAERMITSDYPHLGWVEQDPLEIGRSSVRAIRDVMGKADIRQEELLTFRSYH